MPQFKMVCTNDIFNIYQGTKKLYFAKFMKTYTNSHLFKSTTTVYFKLLSNCCTFDKNKLTC